MARKSESSRSSARSHYGRVMYPHYVWVIVTVIAVMQMVGTSIRNGVRGVHRAARADISMEPRQHYARLCDFERGNRLGFAFCGLVRQPIRCAAGDGGGYCDVPVGDAADGLISTIWELYLYFGVLLGVAQAIFLVPLIPAAMDWFKRHLGIGMGLIMASWGLGPALAAPVVSLLLESMGWRNGFIALGVGSAAIMFVLIGLFRDRPADKGVQPYGYRPGDVEAQKRKPDPARLKLFNGYMRKTAAFWNMGSIHFLGCVGHAIILVYIVPLAVKEGMTPVQAAGVLTVLSAVSIITRVFVPIMCDTIGRGR